MSVTATATTTKICDAVVQLIDKTYALVSPDAVQRKYLPDVSDIQNLSGRKVYVSPGEYGQADTATRALDRNSFTVDIVVVEKYTAAGEPTTDWVDERMDFVELMWRLLSDARTAELLEEVPEAIPVSSRVGISYDWELLREKKLFFSQFEVVYEIDET